jgi:ABC-type lipoprotein export system ATPase subunit
VAHFSCRRPQVVAGDNLGALTGQLGCRESAKGVDAGHERLRRAQQLLVDVGLADRMANLPSQLSGGQQQRVAIARALVNQPDLVLADEPTGALDSRTGEEVMDLVSALHQSGITIVLVTHDSGVAARTQRIIRLQDGRIIADGELLPHSGRQTMD